MKLMDIDSDTLGIPDTEYDAHVSLPSAEFARICRDLNALGESVRIEVTKEGIRFASDGEAANGSVLLKQNEGGGGGGASKKGEGSKVKKESGVIDVDMEDGENSGDEDEKVIVKKEDDDEDEDEDEDGDKKKKKQKQKPKKKAKKDDDDAEEDEGEGESEAEGTEPESDSESGSKKRKRKPSESKKSTKKVKKEKDGKKKKDDEDGDEEQGVSIQMTQPVNLTFSLKYLVNFSKSSNLCSRVKLMMSNEVPLMVRAFYIALGCRHNAHSCYPGPIRLQPGPHPILPRTENRRRVEIHTIFLLWKNLPATAFGSSQCSISPSVLFSILPCHLCSSLLSPFLSQSHSCFIVAIVMKLSE